MDVRNPVDVWRGGVDMTLFRSPLHRDVWRQRWCETCFQPDEAARRLHGKQGAECPIWLKAMREDRKPPQWDRMPRANEMEHTIRCNSYTDRPPIARRATSVQNDVPLFDVTPYATDVGLVPVEGWPDRPAKDGTDHA